MFIDHLIPEFPARRFAAIENASREEMLALQNRLLARHIRYVGGASPFYQALFRDHGFEPEDIETVEDLRRLPLTDKDDLAQRNAEFLAVSPERIADVCLTSATTSDNPTPLLQTRSDLSRLAWNEEAAFITAGLDGDDTLLVLAALDRCFMAGLAYFLGALRLGARAIRGGSGSAAHQWQIIRATRPTALVGVPSLMRRIAAAARDVGEDPATSTVRRLIAIGETIRGDDLELLPAAQRLTETWNAPVHSTYASTEIATTFCECPERRGGHLRPELLVLEIVDDAGIPVSGGQPGEVVVTPLGVEGMPLVRFRTGDVARVIEEPCACGRTSPRLGPILGRRKQMLKYKGTTIFPGALLAPLESIPHVAGAFVEVRLDDEGNDRVTVCVAVEGESLSAERLGETIRAHARVLPEVRLITADEYHRRAEPASKRKRLTFFDYRTSSS